MSTAVTFKHITDEVQNGVIGKQQYENCLLYTSDAADEG